MPNGEALKENSAITSSPPQIASIPNWFLSYSLERVVYYMCLLSPSRLQPEAAFFMLSGNLPSFPSPYLVI